MTWREKRAHRKRVREALRLILDHKDPLAFGYTCDENSEAIDLRNDIARANGWGSYMGKPPTTMQPDFPGCRPCGTKPQRPQPREVVVFGKNGARCGGCKWFIGRTGDTRCSRYPQRVYRAQDDFCGEFEVGQPKVVS